MYILFLLKIIYVLYINEIKNNNPQPPTKQMKSPQLNFEIDDMVFVFCFCFFFILFKHLWSVCQG